MSFAGTIYNLSLLAVKHGVSSTQGMVLRTLCVFMLALGILSGCGGGGGSDDGPSVSGDVPGGNVPPVMENPPPVQESLVNTLATRFVDDGDYDYWQCLDGRNLAVNYRFFDNGMGFELDFNDIDEETKNPRQTPLTWVQNGDDAIFVTIASLNQAFDITGIQFRNNDTQFRAQSTRTGVLDCSLQTVDTPGAIAAVNAVLPTRFVSSDDFDVWACATTFDTTVIYRFNAVDVDTNLGRGLSAVLGAPEVIEFTWAVLNDSRIAYAYDGNTEVERFESMTFTDRDNFTTASSEYGDLVCQRETFNGMPDEMQLNQIPASQVELATMVGTLFVDGQDFSIWDCLINGGDTRYLYSYVVDELGETDGFGITGLIEQNPSFIEFNWQVSDVDSISLSFTDLGTQEDLTSFRFDGGENLTVNSSTHGNLTCERVTEVLDRDASRSNTAPDVLNRMLDRVHGATIRRAMHTGENAIPFAQRLN